MVTGNLQPLVNQNWFVDPLAESNDCKTGTFAIGIVCWGGWHVIRVTRNRAAHTEFVFGDVAIQLGKTLDKFAAQGIFQQMFRLKAKYRGEMN